MKTVHSVVDKNVWWTKTVHSVVDKNVWWTKTLHSVLDKISTFSMAKMAHSVEGKEENHLGIILKTPSFLEL